MISGSAFCRLRWRESTSALVLRLVFESVFHFSIRSFARSTCVACATCSNCDRIRFSWLTEAYGTAGPEPAGAEAAGAGEGVSCAIAMATRKGNTRKRQPKVRRSFMRSSCPQHTHFRSFRKIREEHNTDRSCSLVELKV